MTGWPPFTASSSESAIKNSKTQSISSQHAGADCAVGDVEHAGIDFAEGAVADGAILPAVAFDRGDGGNTGGDAGGVQEGEAGAAQVLHAEEHAVLLGGGTHEEGL